MAQNGGLRPSPYSVFLHESCRYPLNGDVRTMMFGADYARGRMVTGVSLARSMSLGGYSAEAAGQVESLVTGLYPWIGYQLTERVSVWSVAGYGAGGSLFTWPQGSLFCLPFPRWRPAARGAT